MAEKNATATEQLTNDIKVVIAETEKLLKATAGQTGDKIQAVRDRVAETLESARAGLAHLEKVVVDHVKSTSKATDQLVRENPWPVIGVAAGLGLIAGLFLARRK